MEITKELLNNLGLKKGVINKKRQEEINELKIRNPYYPAIEGTFTPGEFFVYKDRNGFISSIDERIGFQLAFGPYPITIRESAEKYDDIFLLIIEKEWFKLIFDYLDSTDNIIEGERQVKLKYELRKNEWLDKRCDKNEIIFLLEEFINKRECICDKQEINIVYEGKEYPWRNWKEL